MYLLIDEYGEVTQTDYLTDAMTLAANDGLYTIINIKNEEIYDFGSWKSIPTNTDF